MANTRACSPGSGLSRAEQIAGFCYLPVFVAFLGLGIGWLNDVLELSLTDLQINVAYFVVNAIFVWIIFHGFLLRSFRSIRFWELVQALILGVALYYAGNFLFSLAVKWLGLHIPQFNDDTVSSLVKENRTVMIVCGVLLAPLTEETLVRGLVFGTVRRKNRILAYAISILFFAFIHVWQYLPANDIGQVALSALLYLPAGIALAWTYEKANTIWAPIALHMVINAISFGILT